MAHDSFATRILLVDDEPIVTEGLRIVLESVGFACQTATNGLEALLHLSKAEAHIVVSDLRMPLMSGYELVAALRSCHPEIGIVVISAESGELDLPIDAYLQKGKYSPEQLIATIRAVEVKLRRKQPLSSRLHPVPEKVCEDRASRGIQAIAETRLDKLRA
jgi:YesN/AraC family two-component response regulator